MKITTARLRQLETQFSRLFANSFAEADTWADQIATRVPSSAAQNDYGWLSKLPQLREWLGERQINNLVAQGYSLKNKTWEGTVGVSRDDIEDDNLGVYSGMIIPELGRRTKKHPDTLLAALLVAGDTSECYDGQYFFDTDHPIASDVAGTQLNYTSTGLALTQANFLTVRARMMTFKGADNQNMGIVPNLLVVPPALEGTALEITDSERILISGGATYAATPTNVTRGMAKTLVIPELAGNDTTWYALATTGVVKPFIHQIRRPASFTAKTAVTDENVWRFNEYQYGVDGRWNAGYGLWFMAYKAVA